MPFIQCPNCNVDISDVAQSCPRCGHPIYQNNVSDQEFFQAPPPNYQQNGQYYPTTFHQQTPPESPIFAILTLVAYFVIYPIGFFMNVVGLATGPKRGCFAWMFLVFVVLPVILFSMLLVFFSPAMAEFLNKLIAKFQ